MMNKSIFIAQFFCLIPFYCSTVSSWQGGQFSSLVPREKTENYRQTIGNQGW